MCCRLAPVPGLAEGCLTRAVNTPSLLSYSTGKPDIVLLLVGFVFLLDSLL
jgi:hypothetical protein